MVSGVLAHAMNLNDMVVDDSLDEVEESLTDKLPADEGPGRPRAVRRPYRLPEEHQSGNRKEIGCGVEETVAQRVDLKSGHGGDRVAGDVADHMVPLEKLMQHNAIEAPTQAKTEQEPHGRKAAPL